MQVACEWQERTLPWRGNSIRSIHSNMIRLQLIELMKKEPQPPPRSRQQEGEFISSQKELPTRSRQMPRTHRHEYPVQLKHKYQKKKQDTPKGKASMPCTFLPCIERLAGIAELVW